MNNNFGTASESGRNLFQLPQKSQSFRYLVHFVLWDN